MGDEERDVFEVDISLGQGLPGRFGRVSDVLFDASGGLAMILLLRRYKWLRLFPENLSFRIGMNAERQSKIS